MVKVCKKDHTPFFSIIIPVFNAKKYIRECIESIITQEFRDLEIIAVDDGSIDSSLSILEELATYDDRIKVFHKKNGGLTSTRKYGCEKATGEYILNVDSDDFVENCYLSKIYEELKNGSFPDMLAIGYTKVDETGFSFSKPTLNDLKPGNYKKHDVETIRSKYLFDKDKKGINSGCLIFSVCAKIVKRIIYVRNQKKVPNEIKFGEDLILTYHLVNDIDSLSVSNYSGYYYRTSQTSMMTNITIDSFSKFEQTIDLLSIIFSDDINKVSVYSEGAIFLCLNSLAKLSHSFSLFKSSFTESLKFQKMWALARQARYRMTFKGFFRHLFIKHKSALLIYLISKLK